VGGGEEEMIETVAMQLTDNPFSVAVTVSPRTPTVFPAVNVVDVPVVDEMEPSVLFKDQV
jgi:hypothetical protein